MYELYTGLRKTVSSGLSWCCALDGPRVVDLAASIRRPTIDRSERRLTARLTAVLVDHALLS